MPRRLNIGRDDLPPEWAEMADVLGVDHVVALAEYAGGEILYVPHVSRFERGPRNRAIRSERAAGASTGELARRWGLSERQILRIVGD